MLRQKDREPRSQSGLQSKTLAQLMMMVLINNNVNSRCPYANMITSEWVGVNKLFKSVSLFHDLFDVTLRKVKIVYLACILFAYCAYRQ